MTKDLLVGPLKFVAALCPETLLKNFTLTLAKNYKKIKKFFLTAGLYFLWI